MTYTSASDTFSRGAQSSTWGTASDGETYNITSDAALSLDGTYGIITGASKFMYLGSNTLQDAEAAVSFKFSATGDYGGITLRQVDANNYIQLLVKDSAIKVREMVAGVGTDYSFTSLSLSINTLYHMKFRVVGKLIYGRWWVDGNSEPTTWAIAYTSTTTPAAGKFGLVGQPAAAHTYSFNSFTLVQAFNLSEPTRATFDTRLPIQGWTRDTYLTATSKKSTGRSSFITAKHLISAVQDKYTTQFLSFFSQASDTFTRANQSGLGTASDSETWNKLGGTSPTLAISSNEGTWTGVTGSATYALGTNTIKDAEAVYKVKITASGDTPGVVLRCDNTAANLYRAFFSGTTFTVGKVISGSSTNLSVVTGQTFSINTFYWIKLRVVGTNIYGKFWASGVVEPSGWNVSTTDSSLSAAGRYGIRISLNASGDTASFDSFMVNKVIAANTETSTSYITSLAIKNIIRLVFRIGKPRAIKAVLKSEVQHINAKFSEVAVPNPYTTIDVSSTVTDMNNFVISNLTSATVVVTFPDGSVSSPLSANSMGSGVYTITYTTKMPGFQKELWSFVDTSGATAQYTNVIPIAY